MRPLSLAVIVASFVLALIWLAMRKGVSEAIKSYIERRSRERELRATKLHEELVKTIEGIKARIPSLMSALNAACWLRPLEDPHGLEPLNAARSAGDDLKRFVDGRSHYLPKKTRDSVKTLLGEMHGAWVDLDSSAQGLHRGSPNPVYLGMKQQGCKTVREKLPLMISALDDEFREVLGG